jgi:hypothetical protein
MHTPPCTYTTHIHTHRIKKALKAVFKVSTERGRRRIEVIGRGEKENQKRLKYKADKLED